MSNEGLLLSSNADIVDSESLPLELWLEVFRIALGRPSATNVNPRMFDFPGDPGPDVTHHRMRKATIVTKRRLVAVCKTWYLVASPFLYEHIVVQRCSSLPFLCNALARAEPGDSGKGASSLGFWTKRLDIAINDATPENLHMVVDSIAEIIRSLPNLSVIVFNVSGFAFRDIALPLPIVHALREHGSSVQVLNWYTNELPLAKRDWYPLLSALPNLRALHLGSTKSAGPNHPLPVFPSLRTLSLDDDFLDDVYPRNPEVNIFPSLCQVIYAPSSSITLERRWRLFLTVHGPHLSSIIVRHPLRINLQHHLDFIRETCPRLTSLTIIAYNWSLFNSEAGVTIPSSVKLLGLGCDGEQQPPYDRYVDLCNALSDMHAPGLALIQFKGRNLAHLQARHPTAFRSIREAIRAKGWRLKDGVEYITSISL